MSSWLSIYDTESSEKDAEIVRLKARLAALGSPERAPDVITPPATAPGSGITPPTSTPVSVVTLPTTDTLPSHVTTTPPPGLPVSTSAPLCVDTHCVPASSGAVTPAVTFVSSYTTPTPTVTPIVASGTVPGMTVSHAGVSRGEEEKGTYQTATQALCTRLDPGNRILAAQDF